MIDQKNDSWHWRSVRSLANLRFLVKRSIVISRNMQNYLLKVIAIHSTLIFISAISILVRKKSKHRNRFEVKEDISRAMSSTEPTTLNLVAKAQENSFHKNIFLIATIFIFLNIFVVLRSLLSVES